MARRNSAPTLKALELVRQGMPAYRAALNTGIQPSTIYRALKRERENNNRGK